MKAKSIGLAARTLATVLCLSIPGTSFAAGGLAEGGGIEQEQPANQGGPVSVERLDLTLVNLFPDDADSLLPGFERLLQNQTQDADEARIPGGNATSRWLGRVLTLASSRAEKEIANAGLPDSTADAVRSLRKDLYKEARVNPRLAVAQRLMRETARALVSGSRADLAVSAAFPRRVGNKKFAGLMRLTKRERRETLLRTSKAPRTPQRFSQENGQAPSPLSGLRKWGKRLGLFAATMIVLGKAYPHMHRADALTYLKTALYFVPIYLLQYLGRCLLRSLAKRGKISRMAMVRLDYGIEGAGVFGFLVMAMHVFHVSGSLILKMAGTLVAAGMFIGNGEVANLIEGLRLRSYHPFRKGDIIKVNIGRRGTKYVITGIFLDRVEVKGLTAPGETFFTYRQLKDDVVTLYREQFWQEPSSSMEWMANTLKSEVDNDAVGFLSVSTLSKVIIPAALVCLVSYLSHSAAGISFLKEFALSFMGATFIYTNIGNDISQWLKILLDPKTSFRLGNLIRIAGIRGVVAFFNSQYVVLRHSKKVYTLVPYSIITLNPETVLRRVSPAKPSNASGLNSRRKGDSNGPRGH